MTEPLPLRFPAGIVKVDSARAAVGRYTDSDKVRFKKGKAEKWAGWEKLIDDETLVGIARGAVSWRNADGNLKGAFGTHRKLYVLQPGATLQDITPIQSSGTLDADPFTTTNGFAVVNVLHLSHGRQVNDSVTFDGATAVGGITIDGEYYVTAVVDPDNYTITHTSSATSTATGGGAAVTYSYQLTIGYASVTELFGWGTGRWGEGTWGTPREEGILVDLRHWSLAEYENNLLASPSGGGLYLWEEATDAVAEIVPGAPTEIRAMFVTGERFVMALGTTSPMTVQWPDLDDITNWTASDTTTANTRTLQSGSKLIAGVALTDNVNLVWSDTSLYVFQYTGSDFIYDSRLAGIHCGLAAPLAFAKASGIVFWMSATSFHMYAGSVQKIPRVDEVEQYIFRNINPDHITKTWAEYDQEHNQVRFHYCHGAATEPDRYVDVSLDTWDWTVGTLGRTTGMIYDATVASILMVDSSGYIYTHNTGLDADGGAMSSYLTFPMVTLTEGRQNVDVMEIIGDFARQTGTLSFALTTKENPRDSSNYDSSTVTLADTASTVECRVSGRHLMMTMTSNAVGGDFRLGDLLLDVVNEGER
jgi:hypothetical protein